MRAVKRWRRRLTDPMVTVACRALLQIAAVSTSGVRRASAQCAATMLWSAHRGYRRIILANLEVAFPEQDDQSRQHLGRRTLFNTVLNALEFAHLASRPERVRQVVELDEHAERLQRKATDRPTILVMPHLGSWELMGHAVSANGIPATSIAHRLRNVSLDQLLTRIRTQHGLEIVHAQGAAREVVKALRRGRHLGILMDQNTRPTQGGAYADFFGLPATVTRAPAVLATRFDTDVLAGACVRTDKGFRVDTEPLAKPVAEYDGEPALLQAMMDANETLIRRHPEQYAWTYRRWRYIPAHASQSMRDRFPFYARPSEYDERTRTSRATPPMDG